MRNADCGMFFYFGFRNFDFGFIDYCGMRNADCGMIVLLLALCLVNIVNDFRLLNSLQSIHLHGFS